jgi:hypothetical protein
MSQPVQNNFKERYEDKGAQQIGLQEYLAKQAKAKKSKLKIPKAVKYILATPLIIVSLFGIFFIPYMIFMAVTSSSVNEGTVAHTQITSK